MKKYQIVIFVATVMLAEKIYCKERDYTEDELRMMAGQAQELHDHEADPPYFNNVTFFAEFADKSSKFPEIVYARRYFKSTEDMISKERYSALLRLYLDGTVHDELIDEVIREEAHARIEEHLEEYLRIEKAGREEFSVNDLFLDIIIGHFHDWEDKAHPDKHPKIDIDDEEDL